MPSLGRVTLVAGGACLLFLLWWSCAEGPFRDPRAAMADFENPTNRAEDQLTDPLVLNGRRVAPHVLRALSDPKMRLRRYAIGFLGCSRHDPSLPALRRILSDPTEQSYFRADALEAIYLIKPPQGLAAARRFTAESDLLGATAQQIVAGEWQANCRTWWQAFTHRHE